MGLDMTLEGKIHLPSYQEKTKIIADKISNTIDLKNIVINEIIFEAMSWRKANAIHKWFVNTIQDSNDDCGEYFVTLDQLNQLKDLCDKVTKNNKLASELLPSIEGFFFGSQEYNEWYFKDLKDTSEAITKLNEYQKTNKYAITYYYSSSW